MVETILAMLLGPRPTVVGTAVVIHIEDELPFEFAIFDDTTLRDGSDRAINLFPVGEFIHEFLEEFFSTISTELFPDILIGVREDTMVAPIFAVPLALTIADMLVGDGEKFAEFFGRLESG